MVIFTDQHQKDYLVLASTGRGRTLPNAPNALLDALDNKRLTLVPSRLNLGDDAACVRSAYDPRAMGLKFGAVENLIMRA